MKIEKEKKEQTLFVKLEGRLDTKTSPDLENEIFAETDISNIYFDFEKLVYVASAGLRVLLKVHKALAAQKGKLVLRNISEDVMEVLEMTGFADILTIE